MENTKKYYHVLSADEQKQNLAWDYLASSQAVNYIKNHVVHSTNLKDNYGHDFVDEYGKKQKEIKNHDVFNCIGGIKTYICDDNKFINPIHIKRTLKQLAANEPVKDTAMLERFEKSDDSAYVQAFNSLRFNENNLEDLGFLKNDQINMVAINGSSQLINGHIDRYDDELSYVINRGNKTYFYNHVTNDRFDKNNGVVEYLGCLDYELFIPNNIEKPYEIQGYLDSIFYYHTDDINDSRLKVAVYFLLQRYFNQNNYSLIYLAARSNFSLDELIAAKEYILNKIAKMYNEAPERTVKAPTNILSLERKYFNK